MTPDIQMQPAPETKPPLPTNPFGVLSIRDWLYLPHLLGGRERALLAFFVALALISGSAAAILGFIKITKAAPKAGGIFREGVIRPPERINPLFLSDNDTDRDISALIFGNLFYYDADDKLQPEIAEEYSVSEDGKSYVVTLKKNVSWHDGQPLTADDVVYTVKTIQDPAYKSSLRPNWQGVTIERLGEYEVRFVLHQPYSPFVQNLALPIIPQHIWKRVPAEAAFLVEANLKPVGAGPYRFSNFERNSDGVITKYVLKAVDTFYLEGPYIKTIELKVYNTEEDLLKAFQNGDIDGISILSSKNVERVKNLGAAVSAIRIPRILAVFLNEAHPALADRAVRQALAMAIDKQELITSVLGGGATVIESPIPPGTFGYNPDIPSADFAPDSARAMLEKAGWQDLNNDGLREKKPAKRGGSPTPLKIVLATSDWRDLAESANMIKNYWRQIGVETEVKTIPINELESSVIRPRAYDALLFGEIFGHDPDPFAFWHSSQLKDPGLNIALYHSKKVDSLLEEARRMTDRSATEARYREFQDVIAGDFPSIFLYSPVYSYATRSTVQGVNLKSLVLPSERFNAARLWYIKTKRVF
ncbi:MAG: peptide ABC transporter substrate-binding protein [Candidatus Sungbacteria bacterium]|uniref:Peptide ABC transporter substrate-binding protein n=1 Tax=Candidatus Sungiibacteriota bacterium TaxID=2750080 RepID=A0A931SCC8_9BACT|nr:peptide ABC transporter substrate-binding protein [Candidatus Sungbacteria bacterium]